MIIKFPSPFQIPNGTNNEGKPQRVEKLDTISKWSEHFQITKRKHLDTNSVQPADLKEEDEKGTLLRSAIKFARYGTHCR